MHHSGHFYAVGMHTLGHFPRRRGVNVRPRFSRTLPSQHAPYGPKEAGHGDVAVPMSAGAGSVGELWWTGGEHRWVFFDDDRSSETYAEQVEHAPRAASSSSKR